MVDQVTNQNFSNIQYNETSCRKRPSRVKKVVECTNPWWLHLLTLPISTFMVEGLAKVFNFEVLRHGTDLSSYLSILKNGANPSFGGAGASCDNPTLQSNSKGYFHVTKDTELPIQGHILKRMSPRMYAALSGVYKIKKNSQENKVVLVAKVFFAYFSNLLFSPTLRFIFNKEEIHGSVVQPGIFENDPDSLGFAYRTKEKIGSNRIGIVALFKQIEGNGAKEALTNHPGRFIIGIAQLITGIFLTLIGVGILI